MRESGSFIAPDETRRALIGLLLRQGVSCLEDDLVVKTVETRRGHPLHVVFALNGTEEALGLLVERIACRRNASIGTHGVFLLRPDDIQQLISKITA